MAKYKCITTCTFDKKYWEEGQVEDEANFSKDPSECPHFKKIGGRSRKKQEDEDDILD